MLRYNIKINRIQFNLNWLVSVIPEYFNFATFSEDLLTSLCSYINWKLFHVLNQASLCTLARFSVEQLIERRKKVQNAVRVVGFEVFTEVVMKSIIFWDMTPCSPLSCTRRFGGTYRLHFRVEEQFSKPSSLPLAYSRVAWTILRPWRWWRYVPPKRLVLLNGLHGVIFQKMILFAARVPTFYLI
jgi:hypothetical protein